MPATVRGCSEELNSATADEILCSVLVGTARTWRGSRSGADIDLGPLSAQQRPTADIAGRMGDRGADRLRAHRCEPTTPSRLPVLPGHLRPACRPGGRALPHSGPAPSQTLPGLR